MKKLFLLFFCAASISLFALNSAPKAPVVDEAEAVFVETPETWIIYPGNIAVHFDDGSDCVFFVDSGKEYCN